MSKPVEDAAQQRRVNNFYNVYLAHLTTVSKVTKARRDLHTGQERLRIVLDARQMEQAQAAIDTACDQRLAELG